jgi:predicted esterase
VSSKEDKYLLPRSSGGDKLYYKVIKDGKMRIRELRNGRSIDIGPSSGVVFDYFTAGSKSYYLFSDLDRPASLFRAEGGRLRELLDIHSTDTMPKPVIFRNKAGMVNFVYRGNAPGSRWVVWLHGGPDEQMSPRFNVYLDKLIRSGFNVIVLNYPGSTGIGNRYEYRDLPAADLLDIQVKTIREDILSIRTAFPDLKRYSIVGVSHGSIAAHAYVHKFREEVLKLVDFSGIALFSPDFVSNIPTLYLYGQYDFSLKNPDRERLIEADLARGNGESVILKGEGHVINHQMDIATVINSINNFLSSTK